MKDDERDPQPMPIADLVGVAPDWTGGACSVCFVRMQRRDRDGVTHPECRRALGLEGDQP